MTNSLLMRIAAATVGLAFVASAAATQLQGQGGAPARQGGAPGAPAARGGGNAPQGGRGPIKVMVVTKGHTYDREPFFQMWDSWGSDITWSHVEHPAADAMLSPKYSKSSTCTRSSILAAPASARREAGDLQRRSSRPFKTTNNRYYPPPSEQLKTEFPKLLREGKGFVFLHHASAAWLHPGPNIRRWSEAPAMYARIASEVSIIRIMATSA